MKTNNDKPSKDFLRIFGPEYTLKDLVWTRPEGCARWILSASTGLDEAVYVSLDDSEGLVFTAWEEPFGTLEKAKQKIVDQYVASMECGLISFREEDGKKVYHIAGMVWENGGSWLRGWMHSAYECVELRAIEEDEKRGMNALYNEHNYKIDTGNGCIATAYTIEGVQEIAEVWNRGEYMRVLDPVEAAIK